MLIIEANGEQERIERGAYADVAQMEQKLHETWSSEEDSLFYYHPSEGRIVLSHALFGESELDRI